MLTALSREIDAFRESARHFRAFVFVGVIFQTVTLELGVAFLFVDQAPYGVRLFGESKDVGCNWRVAIVIVVFAAC